MKNISLMTAALLLLGLAPSVQAVQPNAKTVPWLASNPLIPHDTVSGASHTLKGTSDVAGPTIEYTWKFGDGSPDFVGTVTTANRYNLEAVRAYAGPVGTAFTASLIVKDTSTGESDTANYYVIIRPTSLDVEINMAIDRGLWYLHKSLRRDAYFAGSGDWAPGIVGSSYYATTPANVNAFEVSGHLETGNAENPYVETVARGLKGTFHFLTTHAVTVQTNPIGAGLNPDSNGNGYGVVVSQGDPYYQGGIFMDAIVASGTPNTVTTTGPAGAGANPGISGRTYKAIVQDMVDEYAWAQWDGTEGGGWRYSSNTFPDNSANQWAAIGMIAAERVFGCTTPAWVKQHNKTWLTYSQDTTGADSGVFGYVGPSPIWGPYNTTPSGMVQMVWNGIGRGNSQWDRTETFMRANFCNTGGAFAALRDTYYGMFSFTKSMLLHDSNGDGVAEPIALLGGNLDWFHAEASKGDACDGVARTLVSDQNPAGYWTGHNPSSSKYPFETAQAIIMLNQAVVELNPVAVAQALPDPGVVGQTINLLGNTSFHLDPARTIIKWEWDLDNNGTFETLGVNVSRSFPALGNYTVRLRVTDDGTPAKTDVTTVHITLPPVGPTASAGGPYVFCPQSKPWFLDGTGSVNPDEGQHEGMLPGDTIVEYAWELDGDNDFNDAFGPSPDVTAFLEALGPGSRNIQLRVKDRTGTSFPSSPLGDLTGLDLTQVSVLSGTDARCVCVDDLAARPKSGKIQLTWTSTGAHHYNIYRGTVSGGPYLKIGSVVTSYATYLDAAVVNNTTYYYVIRPAAANDDELCQSNQASGKATARQVTVITR
jgi:PKD domain